MSRRGRRPTPEEEAMWRRVARTASPMRPQRKPALPAKTPPVPAPTPEARPNPVPAPFRVGEAAPKTPARHDLGRTLSTRLADAPLKMDARTFRDMKKGRLRPEGRIDLHGMTLDQAGPALTRFVEAAHASGKRLVLVITGKGRRDRGDSVIPSPTGILRHQVPQWLSRPPLSRLVLQVSEANPRDGGSGALYVYLARRR